MALQGESYITTAGRDAIAQALNTGQDVEIGSYGLSSQDLAISETTTTADITNFLTENITVGSKNALDGKVYVELRKTPAELNEDIRVISLYLKDGTLFIVIKPTYFIPKDRGLDFGLGIGVGSNDCELSLIYAIDGAKANIFGDCAVLFNVKSPEVDCNAANKKYVDDKTGNRNLLANGSFRIWQRASSYDYTEGVKFHRCVDRWRSRNEGAGVDSNLRVSKDKIGSKDAMKCEIISPATNLTGLNHMYSAFYPFEKADILQVNGETMTISFLLETNFTGTVGFAFGGLENNVPETYIDKCDVVAGEVKRHSFTIDVPLNFTNKDVVDETGASIVIGLANKGDYETSVQGWNNGSIRQSLVGTSDWVETAGNYIKIASAHMCVGSNIEKAEMLTYAEELAICKRYYEEVYNPTASINSYMGNWTLQYEVEKRGVPSVMILEAGNIGGGGTSGVVEIVSTTTCRLRVVGRSTSNQWYSQRIAFDAEI